MSSKNNKTKNTLTLLEKREIRVLKQSKPMPTNKDLAIRFKIHENTVSDIETKIGIRDVHRNYFKLPKYFR